MYAPEWELIGKFFKPVGSLVVAKMDFHNNDIEDARKRGIQVRSRGRTASMHVRLGTWRCANE